MDLLKKTALAVLFLFTAACLGFLYYTQSPNLSEIEHKYFLTTDKIVNVDGANVRVREEGPEEGPVLLLIHGYTASLESWDGWAKNLSPEFKVIRYDLLGHGLTGPDPKKRYSPFERSEFLLKLINQLGLKKITLAGNSLGGLVAWRFTSQNPNRVNKLILVSSGAYSINGVKDTPVDVPDALAQYLKYAPPAGVKFVLKGLFSNPEQLTDERVSSYRDMMALEGNGQAFIEHIEEFVLPNPKEELLKIKAPTLIIWGQNDKAIPVEQAGWLNETIENSELIVLENMGHMPQEEAPDMTAGIVLKFLKDSQLDYTP